MPTTKVSQVLWVAKAAANSGASVETEPSISPARPGCTYCSRNIRRAVSSSSARSDVVSSFSSSLCARFSCWASISANSSSSLRTEASRAVSAALR